VTRLTPPVDFEELDHTADVGIVVRGATPEETLAKLVLAFSNMLSGGGAVPEDAELPLSIGPADLASIAVDTLRELLFRFDAEGVLPASADVRFVDPARGAELSIGVGPYDPDAHAEGLELKAVTLHEARFEREGAGWRAQIVFDI
jgi:SHS2 domain-containing protein